MEPIDSNALNSLWVFTRKLQEFRDVLNSLDGKSSDADCLECRRSSGAGEGPTPCHNSHPAVTTCRNFIY